MSHENLLKSCGMVLMVALRTWDARTQARLLPAPAGSNHRIPAWPPHELSGLRRPDRRAIEEHLVSAASRVWVSLIPMAARNRNAVSGPKGSRWFLVGLFGCPRRG